MCNSTQSHCLTLSHLFTHLLTHQQTHICDDTVLPLPHTHTHTHAHTSPMPGYLFIGAHSCFLLAALHPRCIILHSHSRMYTQSIDSHTHTYSFHNCIMLKSWMYTHAHTYSQIASQSGSKCCVLFSQLLSQRHKQAANAASHSEKLQISLSWPTSRYRLETVADLSPFSSCLTCELQNLALLTFISCKSLSNLNTAHRQKQSASVRQSKPGL